VTPKSNSLKKVPVGRIDPASKPSANGVMAVPILWRFSPLNWTFAKR
jgi:hypothetical protein